MYSITIEAIDASEENKYYLNRTFDCPGDSEELAVEHLINILNSLEF